MSDWVIGIVWAPLDAPSMMSCLRHSIGDADWPARLMLGSEAHPAFPFASVWHDGWGDTTQFLYESVGVLGRNFGEPLQVGASTCRALSFAPTDRDRLRSIQRRSQRTPQEYSIGCMITAIRGALSWQNTLGGTIASVQCCTGPSLTEEEFGAVWGMKRGESLGG